VGDGALVSIVGPSGCGKSTLLRCVAGLQAPAQGQIFLDGKPVDGVPDDLAVVFQDYSRSLYPWLTVRDNVALPLRRRGMGKAERRAAAVTALEQVGLRDATGKYPWQLSGGMQQRVSIARALAYRPRLLLIDEPFGSVDAQTREDLEDLLLAIRGTGEMTILFVTHDIDESVYVGDRVVVLDDRHLVGGTGTDLFGAQRRRRARGHRVRILPSCGRLVGAAHQDSRVGADTLAAEAA
jgi:NitT/TauT family transport system ATP-binding protein